ncbi:SCO3242 family prenyltransferase [Nonomuraea sediminis]|uniref:SCO3242 family prenyltransferase n=1 Tax=Nonomuraea sediminis TaxID=2835864 RepID=UPI001BDCFBDD|nr:UbiA family prenyltransferase [Nonomuraea sediminis]
MRPGRLRALLELVRASAALSVPGDLLAGAAAAGRPVKPGLVAGSICLYWAGMALNDYADREVDARERPERPIPSGRVSPGAALGASVGLTAAGLALAAVSGGRRAMAVAVPLAATVWAYDLRLKSTAVGPVAMAACRALNVLLGGRSARAVPSALLVGAHTAAVTALSRREVEGTGPAVPTATLAATTAIAVTAATMTGRAIGGAPAGTRAVTGVLAASYLGSFGRAQVETVKDGSPPTVRKAVGAGIMALIPLQAALIAGSGNLAGALAVVAAHPLASRLARKVSPT